MSAGPKNRIKLSATEYNDWVSPREREHRHYRDREVQMSLPGARGPSYITSQGTHFLNVPHLRSVKGSSTMEGCLFLYLKKVQ